MMDVLAALGILLIVLISVALFYTVLISAVNGGVDGEYSDYENPWIFPFNRWYDLWFMIGYRCAHRSPSKRRSRNLESFKRRLERRYREY